LCATGFALTELKIKDIYSMDFKLLSIEEYNKLTFEEMVEYNSKYSVYAAQKDREDWSALTLEQKDRSFRSDVEFYVSRGDASSMMQWELILELALHPTFGVENALDHGTSYIQKVKSIRNRVNASELFHFFWATKSPFSQWHPCSFKAKTFIVPLEGHLLYKKQSLLEGWFPLDEQEYSSAEQFMMYQKAMLSLDRETARKIMGANDVRKIKDLGRQVKNFDQYVWEYYRSIIVYEGNLAKFSQNADLRAALLDTKGKTLVEAAPNDTIWGIGLTEQDPDAQSRATWKGKNLLGEILTQIRVELAGRY
jgi:ribA/ribD-fused uncharacterized protein